MSSMETKRLDQEIERHRHVTSTTSCYPSELKARMSNAALDFTLNNELKHIAKQMKHFKVSYERQHVRAFKRQNSSLVVRPGSAAAPSSTMPSPSYVPKPPSSSTDKENNNNNTINTHMTKSASVPFLPDLNINDLSSTNLSLSSKGRRISTSSSVSSNLQSLQQDPQVLPSANGWQDSNKSLPSPKSIHRGTLSGVTTRSFSLIPNKNKLNDSPNLQQFRRSSMFAQISTPKNTRASFGSYSSTNLTRKPRSISIDCGTLKNKPI